MAQSHGDLDTREQDRFLPVANISRIMKKALPANAKVAKDSKETVQECVSEFISFVTSEYVHFPVSGSQTDTQPGRVINANVRSEKLLTAMIYCGR